MTGLNREGGAVGASDSKSLQGFGFLTVVEDEQRGWVGGYLVLNTASRPLEFHCTAPVRPNRAQQILYGPTLADYICGEQIGAALAGKSSIEPVAIFTDIESVLAVRPLVNMPVAHVESPESKSTAGQQRSLRIDEAHPPSPRPAGVRLTGFQVANFNLLIVDSFADDRQRITALMDAESCLDLAEPFERIREAIEETQLRKR